GVALTADAHRRVIRRDVAEQPVGDRPGLLFAEGHRRLLLVPAAGGGVQHVDLAEARHRGAVADRVRLPRLALAVVHGAVQLVRRRAAGAVTGGPEIGRARLVSDIPQHRALLA